MYVNVTFWGFVSQVDVIWGIRTFTYVYVYPTPESISGWWSLVQLLENVPAKQISMCHHLSQYVSAKSCPARSVQNSHRCSPTFHPQRWGEKPSRSYGWWSFGTVGEGVIIHQPKEFLAIFGSSNPVGINYHLSRIKTFLLWASTASYL